MADKKTLSNPFPGLRPFQSDEEHLFFGRESQTLELLQLLRDNRFVGVIGTSGSGKSSLVRCGLLSELYGGSFLEAGTDWEVAVMNPGGGPFNQLSKALVDADIYDSEEADINLKLNATLRRSRLGLVEAIRQAKLPEGTNFLLVVDQFEEIFRYSEAGEEQEEAADDFISMILEAAKQSGVPIYVIITMRSDYIGDCSKFEGLPEEINEGEYLIPRLSREEYKSVIEGPARVGGAKLAPRLLQRLLNDIGSESDQLPCLQHALMRTWDAWTDRQDAEELDLEDYRAIGGMSQALSIHADEIFDTFDDKSTRETATRMFRVITEKGDDNRGIRRPLRLQQLADITNHSIEEVKTVVDPYRKQGVTFLMPPSDRELEADTVIDISHESLMRVWQRLRNWVEEEAQSARIYRRLVDTSSLWKNEEAGLYHDPDLQISQSWRDKYQPNEAWADLYGGGFGVATEFLEASEEEGRKAEREKELARQKELEQAQELAETRERSARNMKRFAAVVGFIAVIAILSGILAVIAQNKAELAQNEAVEAKENLRINFARSDDSLGHSFAKQNDVGQAAAYFARSLAAEPNNPTAIDKLFNLFAYTSPPGFRTPNLDFGESTYRTSAATRDGRVVVIGAANRSGSSRTSNVRVWEASTSNYREIASREINGDNRSIWYNSIDISPNEDHVVLGYGNENFSEILDIKTGENIATIPLKAVTCRYSKDGTKLLINSGWLKVTNIWDVKENKSLLEIETKDFYPRWNHDETKIVFGAHTETKSAVLDVTSGAFTFFEHNNLVTTGASFNPEGKRILTHSHFEGNFYIWDVNSGTLLNTLSYAPRVETTTEDQNQWAFNSAVASFTPDGKKVIIAEPNLSVQLWDADTGKLIQKNSISEIVHEFQMPLFSEDGNRLMIPLQGGRCYTGFLTNDYSILPNFVDSRPITEGYAFLANSGEIRPIHLPQRGITSAMKLLNKNQLLVGSDEGTVRAFKLENGDRVHGHDIIHEGTIIAIAQSPDGKKIATASTQGTIKLWDTEDLSQPIFEFASQTDIETSYNQKLHFGPNEKQLWLHNENGTIVWDLDNGEIIYLSKSNLALPIAAISNDNSSVATVGRNTVRILTTNKENKISSFKLNLESEVSALAFSPDNSFIAISSTENSLQTYALEKNRDTITTKKLKSEALVLEFVPSKNLLIAGCSSGEIIVMDMHSLEPKNNLPIKGKGPCSDLSTNELGHIGAVFKTATNDYATVFDIETGRSITGEISNGTSFEKIDFSKSGTQIVCWPQKSINPETLLRKHTDIGSIWDISISNGEKANPKLSPIFTAFAGKRLNADGIPIQDNSITDVQQLVSKLDKDQRIGKFYNWLLDFPGTRTTSPFRPNPTESYFQDLLKQNNLYLLNEAYQIKNNNPQALARSAIYQLINSKQNYLPTESEPLFRLLEAQKIAPEDPLVLYYSAIAADYLGQQETSSALYEKANNLTPLNTEQIVDIIECQKQLEVSDQQSLVLLNKGIKLCQASKNIQTEKKFIIDRFFLASGLEQYEAVHLDWSKIKNWDSFPRGTDPETIFQKYLATVEQEATELVKKSLYDQAIKLLKPLSLASLITNSENISPLLANIIEWENRETPPIKIVKASAIWKYLDNGIDQGAEWASSGFNDNEWKEGPGKFGYGGDGEQTKLDFGPDRTFKHRTYYFRHTFKVTDESKKPFILADIIRDDGVIVYLNGKEIIRDNMPDGEITYSSYSRGTAWEHTRNGTRLYELNSNRHTIDSENLKLGENILAAEVHQCNNGSSDLGFQLELLGSNESPSAYIKQITLGDEGSTLLNSAFNLIPKVLRQEKKDALLAALLRLPEEKLNEASLETLNLAINIAQKLDLNQNLLSLVDIVVDALEKSPPPNNYTNRVEILNYKINSLRKSGASEESIKQLEKIITSPPRDLTLSEKLIDLSKYYTASMFHYSGWWGQADHDDLRTLPSQYNQSENIPFDLRGIIQLNSGVNSEGETANDHRWVKSNNKVYPDAVRGIRIDSKTDKIHLLTGLLFGVDIEKGKTAANLIIHYEDNSKEEFSLIAKVDIFDYWIHTKERREAIESVDADKIGWIGECSNGDARALTKYSWKNPHPDKKVSHIDFESGLSETAPFVVAITIE